MLKAKILRDLKKCMSKLDFKFENNFSIEVPSNIEHGDFLNKGIAMHKFA